MRSRLDQFVRAVTARVSDDELQSVRGLLSDGEWRLFVTLSTFGQRHALNVFQTVCDTGAADEVLFRAALLHDCGKRCADGRPLALAWYVIGSQLERLPWLYRRLASIVEPLRIYRDHAAIGADLLAAVGSDRAVCELVRGHHRPAADPRLMALKAADQQH